MNFNRQTATPVQVPRSRRDHNVTVLSSLPAGRMVPLAAVPLLREDQASGRLQLSFEMQETAEILMNPIHVDVHAYLVPFLALDRFEGSMDQLNRSYMGQPKVENGDVVPFIERMAAGEDNAIHKYLGLHAKADDLVSTAYTEAYNQIWNMRAKNRSPNLTKRERLDKTLAPAFWKHSRFAHIVPDFDQAVIDGEVALNLVNSRVPVRGIGIEGSPPTFPNMAVRENGAHATYPLGATTNQGGNGSSIVMRVRNNVEGHPAADLFPDVFAELQENGVTVSLSNIELARKTQAFAKIRQRYNQIEEQWIIDMLMDAISIPDQALKQPVLLAHQSTIFGMTKRYATDSGNLSESAVNGATSVQLALNVPKLHTGGVIMVVAEILPEQMFERQRDPFFHLGSTEELPAYLRDYLDPEKVDIVRNGQVDTDHETPNDVFGYEPLNAKWATMGPKVGGKFFRPKVDAGFDEDRQRLWSVEAKNPKLSEDFYISTNIHTKPFLDTVADPFETVVLGNVAIAGNTVFGGQLIEATNDYQAVLAEAPHARITKEGSN